MTRTRSWTKLSQTTLADDVYHAVRSRILTGAIAPGEFLREQEVSDGLGVSRTPVREALGRLASEGFLERLPHRGFRVPDEPVHDLLELYPIVSALELLAGRLALPRMGEAAVLELRRINAELERARTRGDVRTLIELNNRFHAAICEQSGSRRLCELLSDLRGQLARLELWYYSQSERTEESIAEHDELIRAVEERRFERALELLESNMALTYRQLLAEEERAAAERASAGRVLPESPEPRPLPGTERPAGL